MICLFEEAVRARDIVAVDLFDYWSAGGDVTCSPSTTCLVLGLTVSELEKYAWTAFRIFRFYAGV